MTSTAILAINFLLDDIIHLFRPYYFQSFWSVFSLLTHLLLVGGATIACVSYHFFYPGADLANLSGNNAVNVGMVMLSYGAGMEFFRTLRWLILLETTGPIVLCVIQVMKDTMRMFSIYIVIFVAHAIAFYSLYKPFHPDFENPNETKNYTLTDSALKSGRDLVRNLFWRIIETTGPEAVIIKRTGEDKFSMEFSHLMGLFLWAIYQIMISILIINLLIAVMNTSYSELWAKSYFQVKGKQVSA